MNSKIHNNNKGRCDWSWILRTNAVSLRPDTTRLYM